MYPTTSGNAPESDEDDRTPAGDDQSKLHADAKAKGSTRQGIILVDQIYDKKYQYVKTAKVRSRKEKFHRYVIVVAHMFSEKGMPTGKYKVEIHGDYLLALLSEVYKDVDYLTFPPSDPLEGERLWLLFFALPAARDRLGAEKAKEVPNNEAIFELQALEEFVEHHFKADLQKLESLPKSRIEFDILWTLFPPRSLVQKSDKLGQIRVYRVRESIYRKTGDFLIGLDSLDSDGVGVGYIEPEQGVIEGFEGSKSVHHLEYFPLKENSNHTKLLVELAARGEKILELRGRHLQEYEGHALDEKGKRFHAHGRVMVDPSTLDEKRSSQAPETSLSHDIYLGVSAALKGNAEEEPEDSSGKFKRALVPLIEKPLKELTEEEKVLLKPTLYGFSLGDKVWGEFAVSGLTKVAWDDKMIDALVLDERRKRFIFSLIQHHSTGLINKRFGDFVRDKGKGLIGLLTGPPGVGKTFTAEALAEAAHQPLYVISSGELGDTPSSVERMLKRVFDLAETWRAVVLLDEADVFLAQRDNENLSRNGIVSVFLRHLEYYTGILLLTTNRLDTFDKAFSSRIHVHLQYGELSSDTRRRIWDKVLERVKRLTKVESNINEEALEQFSQLELNGRQIKNVVAISHATATYENRAITAEDIQVALEFTMIRKRLG